MRFDCNTGCGPSRYVTSRVTTIFTDNNVSMTFQAKMIEPLSAPPVYDALPWRYGLNDNRGFIAPSREADVICNTDHIHHIQEWKSSKAIPLHTLIMKAEWQWSQRGLRRDLEGWRFGSHHNYSLCRTSTNSRNGSTQTDRASSRVSRRQSCHLQHPGWSLHGDAVCQDTLVCLLPCRVSHYAQYFFCIQILISGCRSLLACPLCPSLSWPVSWWSTSSQPLLIIWKLRSEIQHCSA